MFDKPLRSLSRRSRNTISAALAALLSCAAAGAFAVQPVEFNYQAKLTDTTGAPLQGQHTVFVSLWDGGTSGTANSGTEKFAETASVTMAGGVMNHVVGTGANTFGGPLTDAVFASSNEVFLQIAIDAAGNVILPRARLEPSPFSVSSRNGVPSGFLILGNSPAAPPGYTATGNFLSSVWQLRTPMNTGRAYLGAAAANGKIYTLGGLAGASIDYTNINEQYDPVTNSWTPKAPLPTLRAAESVAELDGRLYAMGGLTTNTPALATNRVDVYDPATDSWATTQSLNTPRLLFASATANGKIYAFGGANSADSPSLTNSVEAYDPATNMWTPKTPMLSPRYFHMAANVNGIIYVVGGFESSTSVTASNNAYDPIADSWSNVAPMPEPISAGTAVGLNGKLYVISGATGTLSGVTGNVYIYDPISDTWSSGVASTVARFLDASAVINGKIYVLGGSSNGSDTLATNELFDPQTYYFFSKD